MDTQISKTVTLTFQQTKEFRNIKFEECTVRPSVVLVRDEDESLTRAGRSAKRRRIEKLADDFFNGVPVFISSARPCPQSLKSTVAWHKKTSGEPDFTSPNAEASKSNEDSVTWEEQETDLEILERLVQQGQRGMRRSPAPANTEAEYHPPNYAPEVVRAQASCASVRRQRPNTLHTRPSEEALRQAAALRARRLQRANSEIPVMLESVTPTPPIVSVDEPQSEPSREPHANHPTSSWLSRRQSRSPFHDGEDLDVSIDELQLSGNNVVTARPRGRNDVLGLALAPDEVQVRVFQSVTQDRPLARDPSRGETTTGDASYNTAQEQADSSVEPCTTHDSQHNALITPAHVDRAASAHGSAHNRAKSVDSTRAKSSGNYAPQQSSTRLTRSAALRQAHLEDTDASTASEDSRHGVQSEPKQSTYTTAQRSQNGSTPLKFRKGHLRSRDASTGHGSGEAPKHSSQDGSGDLVPNQADAHLLRQDSAQDIEAVSNELSGTGESMPERWAGTQFLLNQAQEALIISPEKQPRSAPSANNASSQTNAQTPQGKPIGREPLKQLSQEPLPSTQQLLGDFNGWSTVKKLRVEYSESPMPTPTATGKVGWAAINDKEAEMCATRSGGMSKNDSGRTRSSLRFSVPLPASPGDINTAASTEREKQSSSKPPQSTGPMPTATHRSEVDTAVSMSASSATPGPPLPSAERTEDVLTSRSFTSAPLLSSFQPGQTQTDLSRELSNLSATIEDLTRDLLNVDDVQGVWSQVG